MTPPNGLREIVAAFGDVAPYIRPDGTVRSDWEWHTLTVVDLPAELPLSWNLSKRVGRVRCHFKLAPIFNATFRAIHAADLWKHLHDFGGIYEFRRQRKGRKLSLHAWGAAVDLNTIEDPQGDTDIDMHPDVVRVFKSMGFSWGGDFTNVDAQHFQFATGY